jgi:FtsP/CotA-like multicopper oxidase with cupredoxin domain
MVLRTTDTTAATSPAPGPDDRPAELDGRLLTYDDLRAAPAVRLGEERPDTRGEATLTGRNARFHWGINGDAYPANGSIDVYEGERARLLVRNTTNMWHPMHLHGHTFRLGERPDGPRKDTVIVRPGESFAFDTVCDNPGQWMLHCHNGYHLEAGMAIAVRYLH